MVVSCSCWSCAGLPIWHFWSQFLKFRLFWCTWLFLKIKNTSQNLAFSFLFFSVWKAWLWQNIVWAAYSLRMFSDGSLWPCRVQRMLYLQGKKILLRIGITFYRCFWWVFSIYLCLVMHCFMCSLYALGLLSGLFWLFLRHGPAFLVILIACCGLIMVAECCCF